MSSLRISSSHHRPRPEAVSGHGSSTSVSLPNTGTPKALTKAHSPIWLPKSCSEKVPAHREVRREPLPRNAAGKVLKNVLTGHAENPFVEE